MHDARLGSIADPRRVLSVHDALLLTERPAAIPDGESDARHALRLVSAFLGLLFPQIPWALHMGLDAALARFGLFRRQIIHFA